MAYNTSTKKITGAVSIADVKQALTDDSPDLRTLYRSNSINPWARWKPVYINEGLAASAVGSGVMTMAQRQQYNWGTLIDYAFGGDSFGDINGWINGLFTGKSDADIEEKCSKYWASMIPKANNMYCRLQDFAATNNSKQLISGHGYYHEATPQPTVVHKGSTTLTMGGPIFPIGSRDIEIPQGTAMTIAIPDDTLFVDAWAQSTDLINGGSTSDPYYTDVINDAGDSLSIFETIVSASGGQFNLTKENILLSGTVETSEGQRVNCLRGVVLLKKNPNTGYWTDIVENKCRANLVRSDYTGVISTQDDDKYYTNFSVTRIGNAPPDAHYSITADTESTVPPQDSEIERQARWLCFGQYSAINTRGGTGAQPSWFTGSIYGSNYPAYADEVLERAITAFYTASRAANGKYLDLTRKGYSNGNITPVSTYMYAYTGTGYNNPYEESDFLLGEMLVVEYYKRWRETSSSGTISPFVLIPGYVYKINITRPSGSTQTIDVAGSVHWECPYYESSTLDLYLKGLFNPGSSSPNVSTLRSVLSAAYSAVSIGYASGTYDLFDMGSSYFMVDGRESSGDYAGYYYFRIALDHWYNYNVVYNVTKTGGVTATKTYTSAEIIEASRN